MTSTIRPRIAILADWWWPETVGGAERSARTAALEIANWAEVAVFVPAAVEKVYRDGPLTVHAVRRPWARRQHAESALRHGMEFLTAWLVPLVSRRLARRLREFQPEVTVATNVSRTGPWLIRSVKAMSCGYVRSFHDLSDTCWRRSRLKGGTICTTRCGLCQVKTWMMRESTPAGAVSVCVSRFVQTELVAARLTTPETSLVAYPMIGTGAVPPARAVTSAGKLVLGYIGRIDPVKGIEPAVRTAGAYQRLTGRSVTMVVAGEGKSDYLRQLASLAAKESVAIDFVGHQEIAAFCDQVDAVMIPSTWLEPFGRVPVEVGSRGRPMLISPVGGLPEAAAVSGGRFAFADFQDPQSAAIALSDLLEGANSPSQQAPVGSVPPIERGIAMAVTRALTGRSELGR
jgi:glycosyltransferase involved in cell wall biosynthesis